MTQANTNPITFMPGERSIPERRGGPRLPTRPDDGRVRGGTKARYSITIDAELNDAMLRAASALALPVSELVEAAVRKQDGYTSAPTARKALAKSDNRIPKDALDKAKALGKAVGVSLSAVMEAAVYEWLADKAGVE